MGSIPTLRNDILNMFISLLLSLGISAALSSATPEFGGKRRAECVNTRLPLSTLLRAGYTVKLKKIYKEIIYY